MWKYQNTDELYHHGILGMRWGHRKSNPANSIRSNKHYKKTSTQTKTIQQMQQELNEYNIRKNYNRMLYEQKHKGRTKVKNLLTKSFVGGLVIGGLSASVNKEAKRRIHNVMTKLIYSKIPG